MPNFDNKYMQWIDEVIETDLQMQIERKFGFFFDDIEENAHTIRSIDL